MRYKLFLDDERYPPDSSKDDKYWRIARNYQDACWYVETYGLPYFISFDHDLGGPGNFTGLDFAKWLCYRIMDNEWELPKDFAYYVHSLNPVGKENIYSFMECFLAEGYVE